MGDSAKLTLGDKSYDLPVITGTEGEKAVDITKLRAQSGLVTMDSGYMNTGACTSSITFIDGDKGILKYRGIPIEVLAEKSTFLESAFLLLYGHLPVKSELETFEARIKKFSDVPKDLFKMVNTFPKEAHPMGVISSCVAALSAYYPEYLDANISGEKKDEAMALMLGHLPQLAAAFYRSSHGLPLVANDRTLGYVENFLHLMFEKCEGGRSSKDVAHALDVLLILHADHEQNCSTSTVRMVGSSQANLFATISAGVDALWGPLHGGANQEVLEMLEAIHQSGGDYKDALTRAKSKEDPFRLMGFGHRVYKNFDPRAKIIKGACNQVLKILKVKDPLLDIARGLEEEALADSYFVERKLYPNVDFYSGIIYKALGIPVNMFTVMFAIGRLPGWMAQWKEMTEDPGMKICRPRQIYTGPVGAEYIPVEKRK